MVIYSSSGLALGEMGLGLGVGIGMVGNSEVYVDIPLEQVIWLRL